MFGSWEEETIAITDSAPTTLPPVVGVNVTLKVALWPDVRVRRQTRTTQLKLTSARPDLRNAQACAVRVGESFRLCLTVTHRHFTKTDDRWICRKLTGGHRCV